MIPNWLKGAWPALPGPPCLGALASCQSLSRLYTPEPTALELASSLEGAALRKQQHVCNLSGRSQEGRICDLLGSTVSVRDLLGDNTERNMIPLKG